MKLKTMKADNFGKVSTVLVAVIIIIMVVIVAAVLFLVMSDDNGNNNSNNAELPIKGMGTTFTYDVYYNGDWRGTLQESYIGQNNDNYFVKTVMFSIVNVYTTCPKPILTPFSGTVALYGDNFTPLNGIMPDSVKKLSSIRMDTIDGKKKLEIWEAISETEFMSSKIKAYVDPSNGLMYKVELDYRSKTESMFHFPIDNNETHVLKKHDIEGQTEYEESTFIGTKRVYSGINGTTGSITMECIADCLDGQFGVSLNTYGYFLSENPLGLPTDATYTGETTTLDGTIDGKVNVQIWEMKIISDPMRAFTAYVEPSSQKIYRLVITSTIAEPLTDLETGAQRFKKVEETFELVKEFDL